MGTVVRVTLLLLSAALSATPQESADLVQQGLIALQRGESATALERLESATVAAPEDFRAWMGLAQVRRVTGDAAGAEDAINRALDLSPQTPELAHVFAMYFVEAGEFERAAEFEARYARANPDDSDALGRTASWYLQAKKPREAVEFARSGLERRERAAFYDVLGQALRELGDAEGAEKALRASIRLEPYDEDTRYSLGHFLLQSARFDDAIETFEDSLKVFDKSARLQLGLGVALFGARRFPEAIDSYLRVSRLAPGLEQPHYFLSRALEHAEDRIPEVRQRFKAFSEARPEHYLAPFLEAKGLLAALGPVRDAEQLTEAERLLRLSIERRGNYWESHFELGVVLDRLRRFPEARASLDRAIELSPESPTPYYRLARVLARLGQTEAAEKASETHERLVAEQREAFAGGGMEGPILED